jgi:hypothetical protein
MPGAGARQQQSTQPDVPTASTGITLSTPDAVLGEFGQICVSLPAGGAVIAVRDTAGLRCTVSFGNAQAVGSRLPIDSAFIAQCMETGELVLCEDVTTDQRVPPAVAAASSFRSAVTLPIRAQGSVVGLIQVFCAQPSAIPSSAIAGLQTVAKFFAELMLSGAANDGPAVVGGPTVASASSDRPIPLPAADAVREPSPIASPAAEVTQNATQPKINRTAGIVALADAAKAIRARAAGRTTISHLPSDKPTPIRVWLITAVLLLVLSLLILLLFKTAHHVQSESLENSYATPATQTGDEASVFT